MATAVLRSSSSLAPRPVSTCSPSTLRVRSTRNALRRITAACKAFQAITGIITFSSSWPASDAAAIVASQPDDLEADLIHHLGHRRVHLPRHD